MDGADFRTGLEEAKRTELDRLGSSKLLVALTDASLEERRVIQAAADSERAARETFRAWAADEADDGAREAFSTVAAQEDDHLARVLDALAETGDADGAAAYDPADGGPMHTYLRGLDGTIERIAGGMVARALVSSRTHAQVISFFVNEADEARAALFRDLRVETDEVADRGLDLLETRCAGEEDWEAARMVGEYTIQVAYDDYADALERMGVDPRPVC